VDLPGSFLKMAEQVEDLLGSKPVEECWQGPSALQGYTVGGLAGHLARGVLTAEKYLSSSVVDTSEITDAAGYTATVLGSHDPVDSDFHRAVRTRSEEAAAGGPAALATEVREARERLAQRLNGAVLDQPVQVLQGVVVTVREYLRTRLVELVIHFDDLAVSVGEERRRDIPESTYEAVAVLLAQVAVRRQGGLNVVRGLARRERHPDAIRAI
jgi:uncharacterized protein (TIGR03083 family)